MSENNTELACVYAALILADDGVEITSEKLQTLIKAAGVEVEPVWTGLFAKALDGKNVSDMLMNVGSAGPAPAGGGGAAPTAAGGATEAAKEEKEKEEEKEDTDDDMGFGLFD